MLVLSRRTGEKVVMMLPDGQQIIVEMLMCGNNHGVGITAPADVKVMRGELVGHERRGNKP